MFFEQVQTSAAIVRVEAPTQRCDIGSDISNQNLLPISCPRPPGSATGSLIDWCISVPRLKRIKPPYKALDTKREGSKVTGVFFSYRAWSRNYPAPISYTP